METEFPQPPSIEVFAPLDAAVADDTLRRAISPLTLTLSPRERELRAFRQAQANAVWGLLVLNARGERRRQGRAHVALRRRVYQVLEEFAFR